MFSNVYLDLVWLPQISREKAVLALDEMLDCVPYNKIFWEEIVLLLKKRPGHLNMEELTDNILLDTLNHIGKHFETLTLILT